jgi:hypothetical protein
MRNILQEASERENGRPTSFKGIEDGNVGNSASSSYVAAVKECYANFVFPKMCAAKIGQCLFLHCLAHH